MSLSWPTTKPVGQRFGANPSSIQPNGHTGMDFPMPIDTPLYAADSGNVMYADWATKLSASNPWWVAPAYAGIVVIINHNDGFLTLYAHLNSTDLNTGQFVEKGQLIGYSGTTGLSTGPHLHFEVLGWPLQPNNGYYGRLDPSGLVSGYADPSSIGSHGGVVAPNQRKVGSANVNQRAQPSTSSEVVRVIKANTVEAFTGYVYGEAVNGNELWYQDSEGFVWSGGFTEQKTDGLVDNTVRPQPLSPTQRRVIPDTVNYRKAPNTSSEIIATYKKGDVLNFSHWTYGERVEFTNVWLKGALTGGYIWAGALDPTTELGLPQEKTEPVVPPAPPAPVAVKKTVVTPGVRLRSLPSTTGDVKSVIAAGVEVTPTGYVEAEDVAGSVVWFVLTDGYIHSSGVTDASVTGLSKLPVPAVVAPVAGTYSFKPDFDFVEYRPVHASNCQVGNFPAVPEKIVIHQFDAKAKNPKIDGVIAHFQTERSSPSSAHFAVSGKRIVQLVGLKDRAFHAGAVGNNYIGIEIDPQEDADTVSSVKKLIAALNAFYNKTFEYVRHRDVPGNSTLCGADVTLDKYVIEVAPAPAPAPPVPDPAPVPVPVPTPTPVRSEEEIIDDFLMFLKTEYFRRK